MTLFIYDQGYRRTTTKDSLFPKGGVNTVLRSKQSHKGADIEDKLHADGDKFVIPGREQQPSVQDPATRAYTELAEETQPAQDQRPSLTVAHIMVSPVHMITPSSLVSQAWQRMDELEVSHLIVSEDNSRALGLLSRTDLLPRGKDSHHSIQTLYNTQLIAAAPDALVPDVAVGFIEGEINSMPIIDQDDKVVGIVCRTDLLRLLISGPHLERWV